MKEFKEYKEEQKKRQEEEKKKIDNITEGNNKWKDEKNKLIDSILSEIIYLDLIEETFSNNFQDFKSELEETIVKILNNNFKDKPLIQKEHNLIFLSIKNEIPKIEILNFMTVGITGSGKSCLTNTLLKGNFAVEGEGINPETQEFTRYFNEKEVPGIAIYDTIGVEPFNPLRNLLEIKNNIISTFEKNLKDSEKSLHGIIYCSNAGVKRIEDREIEFIKELNNLYGNSDILTVVFTQSMNENEDIKIKQLREKLNNDKIDIIPVNSKKKVMKIYNQEVVLPQFGIDKLTNSMMKNSKKIVKANLKYSSKILIKEKYLLNTKEQFNEMNKKYKNHEFGNNIKKECETIVKNLLSDLDFNYGDLNLNLEKLERNISDYIEKLNGKIKKNYTVQYKEKGLNKLFEEFSNFNNKYENQLNDASMREHFSQKFDDFFETKIIEEICKVILEKVFQIFMEKTRDVLSEMISDNVTDNEIEDQVNSNVERLLKKINNQE